MDKFSDSKLKFGFKNLGPIQKKGEIENSGLTLLYGFPNSGKSFILRGLYGALAFSDEKMVKELVSFSRTKILLAVEESFESKLRSLIINLSKFTEIYSVLRYEFIRSSTKEFLVNNFQKVVETIYSKTLPEFGKITFERDLNLSFEEIIEIPLGVDDFNKMLRLSTEEFLISIIGVETISNLYLNQESLSDLFNKELENLTYETIKSEIQIPPSFIRGFNRSRKGDRGFQASIGYDLLEISKTRSKVKINGTLLFDKNFINQQTLDLDIHTKRKKFVSETLDTFIERVLIKSDAPLINFSPSYEFRILPELLSRDFSNVVVNYFINRMKSIINTVGNIKEVRFIPFGRTPLIQLAHDSNQISRNLSGSDHSPFLADPSFAIYRVFDSWVRYSEEKLSSSGLLPFDLSVLLQGKLSYDKRSQTLFYTDSKNKTIDIKYASAMANEVSGLILSCNSLNSNGLILVEEPEAQLHPVSQIEMALSIVALSSLGIRIVFSTHSDIFGQVIYFLKKYKPSALMIDELIDDISNANSSIKKNSKPSYLASQVHKAITSLKINVYFIDKDSGIRTVSLEELGTDVPGITESAQLKLLNWTTKISEKNYQG